MDDKGTSANVDFARLSTSPHFKLRYLRALETLFEELNETWNRVVPPNAVWPTGTCESFFKPFVLFSVAIYDGYAQECLTEVPSGDRFDALLQSDLKSHILNLVIPWRQGPIRSYQDALDAGHRGDAPGEWTVRLGESWRRYDHPRHDKVNGSVNRNVIEGLYEEPGSWERLMDRIHKALTDRVLHWMIEHAEMGANCHETQITPPLVSSSVALRPTPSGTVEGVSPIAPLVPADGGPTSWEAIEICFISDVRVQIHIGTGNETLNYAELGFADRRAKRGAPKPNQAWEILRKMAEHKGILRNPTEAGVSWPAVEKRIQEIRRQLRKLFAFTTDPVPFVRGVGYQASFTVRCGPSFQA